MFMFAMPSTSLCAHQRPLALETWRHVLEHILEHQVCIEARAFAHRAEGHCLLPTCADECVEFGGKGLMTRFGPFAQSNQVLLPPPYRMAEGTMSLLVFGAVAGRLVAGRVSGRTIRHQFDQRGAR